MMESLSSLWEKKAVEMNPFDTLSLIDWTFKYNNQLKQFGVKDEALQNGFQTLCDSYARKVYPKLIHYIIRFIQNEKNMDVD